MRGLLENKVLFKAAYPDNLEDMVAGWVWQVEGLASLWYAICPGGSIETIFGKSMWMLVSIAIGASDTWAPAFICTWTLPPWKHI